MTDKIAENAMAIAGKASLCECIEDENFMLELGSLLDGVSDYGLDCPEGMDFLISNLAGGKLDRDSLNMLGVQLEHLGRFLIESFPYRPVTDEEINSSEEIKERRQQRRRELQAELARLKALEAAQTDIIKEAMRRARTATIEALIGPQIEPTETEDSDLVA